MDEAIRNFKECNLIQNVTGAVECLRKTKRLKSEVDRLFVEYQSERNGEEAAALRSQSGTVSMKRRATGAD